MPAGLNLATNGVISGTPTTAGISNFTVKATNSANSDTKNFSIEVTSGGTDPIAPTITTTTLPGGTVGAAYSQTLAATGDTPITWSLETGTLPAGLSLAANGIISGTPTTAGTSNFTVKAANSAGNDTRPLSIVVSSIPDYTVTVAAGITNGTITVNPTTANSGDTITVTITPDSGFIVKSISVKQTANNAEITPNGAGLIRTFIMPAADVTVSGEFESVSADTIVVNFEGIHQETINLTQNFINSGDRLQINYTGAGIIDRVTISGQNIYNISGSEDITWETNSVSVPAWWFGYGIYNIAVIVKINGVPYSKEIQLVISAY